MDIESWLVWLGRHNRQVDGKSFQRPLVADHRWLLAMTAKARQMLLCILL